ncbi:MAG: hypothetical protein GY884_07735 [Proteobacteria bacterium]|nr:hypothetical protein [Pseudomonadota bacterium]
MACGDDWDCLIDAATTCTLANGTPTVELDQGGRQIRKTTTFRVGPQDADRDCRFSGNPVEYLVNGKHLDDLAALEAFVCHQPTDQVAQCLRLQSNGTATFGPAADCTQPEFDGG